MKLKTTKKTVDSENPYTCEFCNRSFKKEVTIITHMCEKKKRWEDRDTRVSTIAYHLWNTFFEKHIVVKSDKRKFRDFINNQYYGYFVRFAKYCVDNVENIESYFDWLIENKVKIDDWNTDTVYMKFLIDFLKKENSINAVTRSINNLKDETFKYGIPFNSTVFDKIGQNRSCHMIIRGKISPWLLYNSNTGSDFLATLNESQLSIIFPIIDPTFWNVKFRMNSESVTEVKSIISKEGI